ncbi:hypothetical protein CANARDRAFT_29507 [[Candida] arabinofermentans NRRL YB-2248]|uniref:Uncharacterized protein n=1 Tax=[Candida] arabinofermentans NRRL YB-2248 TaxID=983967 RepID=A0A1E4SX54_9ASCO|nr:hypothetical protein CANARDRAFT_29507 [[Candida] arabinofermentans NRRL YB-2248]
MAKTQVKGKSFKKSSGSATSSKSGHSSSITKNNSKPLTSKKLQKAKAKSSRSLIEKMNKAVTLDSINEVALSAAGKKKEESTKPIKKAFEGLQSDHKKDVETSIEVKENEKKIANDIVSQLEMISGFSL